MSVLNLYHPCPYFDELIKAIEICCTAGIEFNDEDKSFIKKNLLYYSPEQDDKISSFPLVEPLTERELEVIKLVSQGMTNLEISKLLYISIETVKSHVASSLSKLGARDRTHMTLIAVSHKLISP